MSSNRSLYRMRKQELNDFVAGKLTCLTPIAHNKSDGRPSAECNGGRSPVGVKMGVGWLWFRVSAANSDGVWNTEGKSLRSIVRAPFYRRPCWLWWLLLIWLLTGLISGQTPTTHKVLGRYRQTVWQDQNGLPQNTVQAITGTRDGYLWLGTLAGAARFDGVRFTVFDDADTAGIKDSLITALLEDRHGDLWLGTENGGLRRFRDGRFSRYGTRAGLPHENIRVLLEDAAGDLWVGTSAGLARFKDGRFQGYTTQDGLPHNYISALAADPDGGIWVGTGDGLAHFKDGHFRVYTGSDGLPRGVVRALCWDKANSLWVGTEGGGLSRLKDGRFTSYRSQAGVPHDSVWTLYQDREGSLWVGTYGGGLFRRKDERFTAYTSRDGLPGDRIVALYQDPAGNLWVGTEGGLAQLSQTRFQAYTVQEGLAHDFIRAIYEDRAGNLWLGSAAGLNRFQQGAFTRYTTRDGLAADQVLAIGEDRDGNLWCGTSNGVSRRKEGRFTTYTTQAGLISNRVYSIYGDRAGNVWVGTGGGLHRFRAGRFAPYATGLPAGEDFLVIYEDRAGSLWIGTRQSGVLRLKDDRFTAWTTKDGLASDHVTSFCEDGSGALWIGTHGGGLSRFKDGKFSTIAAKDGLYDNIAFQILPDAAGNLWMSCNRGIYRAVLRELNDFAEGRRATVNSFSYGVADGMLTRECNGAAPAGWRARDGRLWFPTPKGAVAIDPSPLNTQPPLVAIEGALLDRAALPRSESVLIKPGQENLEIRYTGLSWLRPQQINFKYQLVGLDRDWIEAGMRRTAYYPYLPPGEYTFRVIADNGEGVWNTEGKRLRVSVLAPFYLRPWFIALLACAVIGLVVVVVKLRFNQLQKARHVQEHFSRQLLHSQEQERQRIAAELHDSLGQSLLIIKNRAFLASSGIEDREATQEQLDEISASAAHAIQEAREIAYNLRPYQLERFGLTKTLRGICAQAEASSGIEFIAELDAIDDLFAKDAEINLYRIVQESVNNIIKHSRATEARLTIRRHHHRVSLQMQDDGQGFTIADRGLRIADRKRSARLPSHPQSVMRDPQSGGFGLIGIAERARMLGGTYTIDSQPGQGTTIRIEIPLQKGSS